MTMHILDTDTLSRLHAGDARVQANKDRFGTAAVVTTLVTRIEILRGRFDFVLMPTVRFSKFLNTGKGVMGRTLAPAFAWGFWVTPVELQFTVEPATYDRYRNLRPVNWSGTDAIWFKSGHPLTAHWQLHSSSKGI